MKVSVLIPVYNRQRLIVPCIESILNQTYQNFEIIIYDDGSTDNTKFMIENIKDKRIKYYCSEKNHGVSYARNILLDLCRTEIAAWQDSDDLSNKYRLEKQLLALKGNNYIVGNSVIFTDIKEINIGENRIDKIKYEFPFASMMFKVDKDIKFNLKLNYGEDIEWRKKMNELYVGKVLYNICYYIRFHSDRIGVQKKQ